MNGMVWRKINVIRPFPSSQVLPTGVGAGTFGDEVGAAVVGSRDGLIVGTGVGSATVLDGEAVGATEATAGVGSDAVAQ